MKLKNLAIITTVHGYYGQYQRPTGIPITTAIDWENWGVTKSSELADGHHVNHYDQYDLIKDYSNYKEWTQDEWNLAYQAFQASSPHSTAIPEFANPTESDYIDIPFNPYDPILGTQAPTPMPKYKYEKNTSWDALLATTAMYPNYDDIKSVTVDGKFYHFGPQTTAASIFNLENLIIETTPSPNGNNGADDVIEGQATTVSDIPFAILTTDSPKLDLFTTDSILDDLSSLLKTTPSSLLVETTPDLIELLPLFTTAESILDQNTTLHPEFAILDTTEALNQLVTTPGNVDEAATTKDILALLSTTQSMLVEGTTDSATTLALTQNSTQTKDLFDLLSIMTTQPDNIMSVTTNENVATTLEDILATTEGLDLVLDTTLANTESTVDVNPILTTTEKLTTTTEILTTLLDNMNNNKKILSIDDTDVPSKDDRIPSPLEDLLMAMHNNDIDERGKHEEELSLHEILGGRLTDEMDKEKYDQANETLVLPKVKATLHPFGDRKDDNANPSTTIAPTMKTIPTSTTTTSTTTTSTTIKSTTTTSTTTTSTTTTSTTTTLTTTTSTTTKPTTTKLTVTTISTTRTTTTTSITITSTKSPTEPITSTAESNTKTESLDIDWDSIMQKQTQKPISTTTSSTTTKATITSTTTTSITSTTTTSITSTTTTTTKATTTKAPTTKATTTSTSSRTTASTTTSTKTATKSTTTETVETEETSTTTKEVVTTKQLSPETTSDKTNVTDDVTEAVTSTVNPKILKKADSSSAQVAVSVLLVFIALILQ